MNIFLAPIQGVTMACYRNSFDKIFGEVDAYYSPFIATADIRKASRSLLKDILPENNASSLKLIPQLLGNNGEDFKLFSSAITDLGYNEINWNIGCPFPMVTNKKKGSGILPYTDLIKEVLEAACADSSYTLTVKMRLGLNDCEEGLRVIEVLNDYPLGGVIIHARTGKQMYTGTVNLDAFEAMACACKHEITYNGDIFSHEDFLRISSKFHYVKNFMLGRGLMQNPFLAAEIKGKHITAENKLKMVRQFHDEIFCYYKNVLSGEKHICDKMKEFWVYMSVHTDNSGKFMKKLKKCHTEACYLDVVNNLFYSCAAWNNSPAVL